jgi:oligopeptide transport system ATP-binding protein
MENILAVKNLKKHFSIKNGIFQTDGNAVHAVDGVTFNLKRGESFGLVGESGCGKSTLGRTLIRLYEPTSGTIFFKGQDFCMASGAKLRHLRRNMQMIFQDPYASLDPRMTLAEILIQPMIIHGLYETGKTMARDRLDKAKELLELVGLPASYSNRYPHELSGGQRQRISIARALALEPELIIADEPVSALDISIQAQILNLLKDLQDKFKLTFIFISHDLKVVEHFCDRVSVMYLGRIVETASRDELYERPSHPYTQALFSAIPQVGIGKKKFHGHLVGEIPSPYNPPSGCRFHPRCLSAKPECTIKSPALNQLYLNHEVACWLYPRPNEEGR